MDHGDVDPGLTAAGVRLVVLRQPPVPPEPPEGPLDDPPPRLDLEPGRRPFFPPSYPRGPPASVVFTVWLSRTPALGVSSRSRSLRTSRRSVSCSRSQTPASRQV